MASPNVNTADAPPMVNITTAVAAIAKIGLVPEDLSPIRMSCTRD